ncbi:MAG TPA: Gfo/Idh/MocA family oxidoreductase [Stellaceae bacterium]|jgi:predicted dehydrogenase|nr:Gfo/Idh/MocA family oxidoreductase [Stellaceae bacterium]
MIRAAIVGIGRWGRTLIGGVQGKSEQIRFTAGHNRTRANAAAFCADHGIPLRDSLDDILADPEIDAVVFATPHSEHGGQVERTAAAGKHVFMEKPFTLDRASAARAVDAVARAGVVLGVAYPRRFHPGMREMKARIDDGRLGTIAHCYAEQNGPAGLFMNPQSWRAEAAEAPAGGMTAMGVHNLDAMIYLFGTIDEVYATSIRRTISYDAEDTTSVMLQFTSGMSAALLCSLVTAVSYRLAAFGSKGCAELLTPEMKFQFTAAPDAMPAGRHTQPAPEIIEHRGFNGLRAELEAFAAAIRGEAPYPIPPDQVLHCVAAFEAIIRSAATHRPVKISEI